jgi:DNA-binding MarR family transcriptional regulator
MKNLDVKNLQVENPAVAKSSASRQPTEPDYVDANLEVWARELPELDLETEGIIERIHRLDQHLERSMRETSERFELNPGEWRLMAHIRYGGPPYIGRPGKLSKYLGLSTGAMTNRLDNMERRGLIRRLDDPEDRRGVLIELTDDGNRLWEEAVSVQAEKESVVTDALNATEKRELNDLLRRLMHAFETHHGPLKGKDHAQTQE